MGVKDSSKGKGDPALFLTFIRAFSPSEAMGLYLII